MTDQREGGVPETHRPEPGGRYQYVEFELDSEQVSIVQDMENDAAWVQSTHSVPVER